MTDALFDKPTIVLALGAVAAEHGFEADWLNDRTAMYLPQGLVEEACEVLLDHPRLRVLGPTPDYVFVMKLYSARADVDHDDMVRLWSHCTFTTPDEAVALYWEAYPHAPEDDGLADYVEQIASEAIRLALGRRAAPTAPRSVQPRRGEW